MGNWCVTLSKVKTSTNSDSYTYEQMCCAFSLLYLLYLADLPTLNINALGYAPDWNKTQ